MIEHIVTPEMMQERERQLLMILADCTDAYCDINFTKNTIYGTSIKLVDGDSNILREQIELPENCCTYTDMVNNWSHRVDLSQRQEYQGFFDIEHIEESYKSGIRLLSHQYWSNGKDGSRVLITQKIRLYKDSATGDLLGITYILDDNAINSIQEKDAALREMYQKTANELTLLEELSANVPGGYHRCGTEDGFTLQFVSKSFLDVIGWTKEELDNELENKYINIVAPEDREFFMSHEQELQERGRVDLAYRIRRKDGTRRWIQDATIRTEQNGETFYQCTLQDITEYVEKVNREKERAEASSLAKSTFLFNASHDIRTPMNAIQGFARIIADNTNNPEVVQEAVQKIMQSGDMLTNLINDILEVARIERGKDEVEYRSMNMSAHMNKLYEMFNGEMEQAGIIFKMENDIEHPMVIGDDLKLTRMAMNLLSNAKKFTAAGGKVVFGVNESDFDGKRAFYTLFVRDTGIGMSEEFQQRAFEQFERERTSTESGVMGSGLGLAIIKRLCELMNAEYNIDSELGKGTKITIKVALELAKESDVENHNEVDYSKFKDKRILLVEDNEFNREIARYTLEKAYFEIEEAENGFVAVDKLLKAEPGYYDVVLMDIQMPIMDGYTATKEIRNINNEQIANIPIIAMTANAFDEDRQKCLACGMNGHLGKPLEVEKLMYELARALF